MQGAPDRHPLAARLTTIATLITLAGGIAGGWWYILDERERSLAQSDTLRSVRAEQELIRRELQAQTQTLATIREVQREILDTLERRFDKVEDGHDRLAREITDGIRAIALELGRASPCRDREQRLAE